MPVDSLVVFFPIALVVVITIFCTFALCKQFCKADTTKEETGQNRRSLANLLGENSDSTVFRTCSNNSILVASDRNQIASSVSISNSIAVTTNYSACYNMSSHVTSNTTRSNVFSRASSGLGWLNIPPRVSINDAHERNSATGSTLMRNRDLYSRVPNIYSRGAIFDSLDRINTESTNSSARRNSILADPRNYGDDTIYPATSYATSRPSRDAISSNVSLHVSTTPERERSNRTASILPRNDNLFSRVPSLYSHGAVFDSPDRNNAESTNSSARSNSILADPRNYGDDTIYPATRYATSRPSRDATSSDVPLHVSTTPERERSNRTASILPRNDNLFSRVPSLYSHGAVFDSPGRNNAESTNISARSNSILADPRNYGDDTIYPTSSYASSMASGDSTSSGVPLQVSTTGECERSNRTGSILPRNDNLFSRVPSLYSHGAVFDSPDRNNAESINSSVRSNSILADPRNYGDDTIYPTSSYASSMASRDSMSSGVPLPVSRTDERERSNRTASILPRNDNLFSVPNSYYHGSAFDSPHRNNTEVLNTSVPSSASLADPTTVVDSRVFSRATSGSTVPDSFPRVSINVERERSSTTASTILQNEDLFSRVPTVYSHGAVYDSIYRNNAEGPDTVWNSIDIDSRTDWMFTNYLDDNNWISDQPPNYSDVLLEDAIGNQVENYEVPPSLSETPPPSYEEI